MLFRSIGAMRFNSENVMKTCLWRLISQTVPCVKGRCFECLFGVAPGRIGRGLGVYYRPYYNIRAETVRNEGFGAV